MPRDGREYVFKFKVDDKTLQSAANNIADTLNEAIQNGATLDRSAVASVKSSLGDILGVAEKEAKTLQDVLTGVTKLDDSSIKMLSENLSDILDTASQITEAMKATGGSLEWMKQGATLVDDFRNLRAAVDKLPLDKIDAMEASMMRLTSQFQGFLDAFKVTDPAGFFKRFGDEAEKEMRSIEKVKARIEKAAASGVDGLKAAIDKGKEKGSGAWDVEDILDMTAEDIDYAYQEIAKALKAGFQKIEAIKAKYSSDGNVNYKKLEKDADYHKAMTEIAKQYYTLESLQTAVMGSSGPSITINTSEIEEAAQKAAELIKEAKGDLEKAIEGLDLKDIELKIVIPDAKSAEWSSKINDLITEAQSQFDAKPIKVTFDYLNPIKMKRGKTLTTKQQANAESVATEFAKYYKQYMQEQVEEADKALEPIISQDKDKPGILFNKQTHTESEKFLSSFLTLAKTVSTAQDILLKHTQNWRQKMDGELKLKFKWNTKENKDEQRSDLESLFVEAQQVADKYPLALSFDDSLFLSDIQNALDSKVFDVNLNAGEIQGAVVANRIVAPSGELVFNPMSGSNPPPINPPAPTPAPSPNSLTPTNADDDDEFELAPSAESIIADSTRTASEVADSNDVLGKLIQGLTDAIEKNDKAIADANEAIAAAKEEAIKKQPAIDQVLSRISTTTVERDSLNQPKLDAAIAERDKFNQQIAELEQANKAKRAANIDRYQVAKTKGASLDELDAIDKENKERAEAYEAEEAALQAIRDAQNKEVDRLSRVRDKLNDSINDDEVLIASLRNTPTIKAQEEIIEAAVKSNSFLKNRRAGLADPVGTIAQYNKQFWDKGDKAIAKVLPNAKEIEKPLEALNKKLAELKAVLHNTEAGTAKYVATQQQVADVEKAINWKNRQLYMSQKGFVRGLDKSGAQKLVESKDSVTLGSELLSIRNSTGREKLVGTLTPIKEIVYFVNAARESLGLINQSTEEYESIRDTQERFLNIFRLTKWLNDLQLLVKQGEVASEDDIKKFIDFYEGTGQLSDAVAAAKQHLATNATLKEATKDNDLYHMSVAAGIPKEYFLDAAKNALAGMSDGGKQELTRMLTKSGVKVGKTINISTLQQAYDQGVFNDANIGRSYQGELKALIDVLELRSLHITSENALKQIFNEATRRLSAEERLQRDKGDRESSVVGGERKYAGGAKRITRANLDDQAPIFMRRVDGRGQEITFELKGRHKPSTNVDNSIDTTQAGLGRFLKTSGLEDIINEILTKELSSNPEDRAQADRLIEQLFANPNWVFSSNPADIVKTSAKAYEYGKTPYAFAEGTVTRKEQQRTKGVFAWTDKDAQELERAEAALKDVHNVAEAITALANDITIIDAKIREANQLIDIRQRQLNKLTGSRSEANRQAWGVGQKRKDNIKSTSIESLRQQIDVAKQYGTMAPDVVSKLQQLKAASDADYEELKQMADDKDLTPEQSERKAYLKNQIGKHKEAIAKVFYESEGWYVTELLTSSLNETTRKFNESTKAADSQIAEAQSKMGGDYAKSKLDTEHEAKKAQINSNVDALIDEMVNAPIRAVNEQLEADKAKVKKNKKKYVEPSESEKETLYVQAINDYLQQQAQAPIQRQKESLLAQRETLLGQRTFDVERQNPQLKTDFDQKIEALNAEIKQLEKDVAKAGEEKPQRSEYAILKAERDKLYDERTKLRDKQDQAEFKEKYQALGEKIKELDKKLETASQATPPSKADVLRQEVAAKRNEVNRLIEEKKQRVRQLTEEKYGKTDPQIVELDAQIAALEAETPETYKPVASVQEAKDRLEQQRTEAIDAEVKKHEAAVKQIWDADQEQKNIITQAEQDKQDAAAKRDKALQAKVEEVKNQDGTWKTNRDVVTDFAREVVESAKTEKQKLIEIKADREEKQEALKAEIGSLETTTTLHREATEKAKESAEAAESHAAAIPAEQPKPAPQQYQSTGSTPTGGYYTYAPGGMAISASGLATESTLRGIYELLNGGAPVGGWGDGSSKSMVDDISHILHASKIKDMSGDGRQIDPSALRDFMLNAHKSQNEQVIMLDKFGARLGEILQGTEGTFDMRAVDQSAKQLVDSIVSHIVHTHPDASASFSVKDLKTLQAYKHVIRSPLNEMDMFSATSGGQMVTLDVSQMPYEAMQEIQKEYIHYLTNQLSNDVKGVTYDVDKDALEITDNMGRSRQEIIDEFQNKVNAALKEIVRRVLRKDAVIVSNTSDFENKIFSHAQQAIVEDIPPEALGGGGFSQAEQAEIDEIVNELFEWMEGGHAQEAASQVAENIAEQGAKAVIEASQKPFNLPETMSQLMEDRVTRANMLNSKGVKVNRTNLLTNDPMAFMTALKGGSAQDVQNIAKAKLSQSVDNLDAFNNALSEIATKASGEKWQSLQGKVQNQGWYHFSTNEHSPERDSTFTKKAYGSFANAGELTHELFTTLLNELVGRGFKGNVKIPETWTGFLDTDQWVAHADDDKSFEVLVQWMEEKVVQGIFDKLSAGVDVHKFPMGDKSQSWSNLLTDIYQNAPGETFTVQEVKEIIRAWADPAKNHSWAFSAHKDDFYNELIAPVIAKRQAPNENTGAAAQEAGNEAANALIENVGEAATQAVKQAEITVDKDKLNELNGKLQQRLANEKAGKIKRPDGEAGFSIMVKNISEKLFADYSALDTKSADKQLRYLANDYLDLQKFVKTEFYDGLQASTKQLIDDAKQSVKNVLDANGVTFAGDNDSLAGKVVQESLLKTSTGKEVLKSAQPKNPLKVGKIISSVKSPAILRNGRVLQEAKVYAHEAKTKAEKALKAEVLGLEKKTSAEKEKQNKLETQTTKKEQESAQAAQEQAAAETKITDEKEEQQAAETPAAPAPAPTTPPAAPAPSSENIPVRGTNVPQGGNHSGGLIQNIKNALSANQFNRQVIDILNKLAREDTLSGIATFLATAKFGGGNGGGSKQPTQKLDLDADEALKALRTEAAKLTDVTHISDLRASNKGYSLDVYRKELDQIEKITFNINKNTGEITSKTGLQQLARGADMAEKELRQVVDLTDKLHESGALQIDANGADVSGNQTVQNLLNAVKQLRDYRSSLSTSELLDPKNQQQLSQMSITVQNYRKQVEALLKTTAQYSDGQHLGQFIDPSAADDATKVKQAMESMITASSEGKTTFGDLKVVTDNLGNSHYELAYTLQNSKHEVQEMTAVINPLTNEIIVQQNALRTVDSAWGKFTKSLKAKFSSLAQYTISATSIHDMIRYFKQGIQYVREIDAALTELKKVTEGTNTIYSQFLKNMSQVAGVVGSTTSELTQSAADWARLGFSIQEAGLLAQNTAVLMNVSEFEDVNTATEALISSLQAFGYEAGNSIEIVDKLNIVGKYIAQAMLNTLFSR